MSEYDEIFDQIKKNNQTRQEVKNAVKYANFDSIAEILWKIAAKFFGKQVSVLKDSPVLQFAIQELVPAVYHFLKDNWSYFFDY